MQPDYHIHTYLCGHAIGSPEEYIEAAQEAGIKEICFTDHAPDPTGYDPINRMVMSEYPQYSDIVFRMQKEYPSINILYGIEADYYHGCEQFLEKWLSEQNFDIVLGSVHYIEEWGFDNPHERIVWNTVDVSNTWNEYFTLLGQLADTRLYDVIAHLDLPKKFRHRPPDEILKKIVEPTMDKIARAEMAIELNTSGLRRPVAEIYPSLMLLEMAYERDIPICFGSDSHEPHCVGYAFANASALAREAGYTHSVRIKQRKKELVPLPL